jgi:hypothetical protein
VTAVRTRVTAAVMAVVLAVGLLGGVGLVAANNVGAASNVSNCNPVADKADWLLNHESGCYNHNAPTR